MVSFWAIMKSNTFHVKQLWLLFGQLLGIFGLLLILTFGHSDPPPLSCYELHDTLKPTAPFGPLKLKKTFTGCGQGCANVRGSHHRRPRGLEERPDVRLHGWRERSGGNGKCFALTSPDHKTDISRSQSKLLKLCPKPNLILPILQTLYARKLRL